MAGLRLPRWLAPVLILALVAGVVVGHRWLRPAAVAEPTLTCADLAAGCSVTLAERSVTVGLHGELKPLHPFQVWLKTTPAERVRASFSMEGMDMGFNLYELRPGVDGVYQAQVTLPVCVSGRREWIMTLDIDGQRLRVPFVTEL